MAKGTINNECITENGELKCRRFRRSADGTETTLATVSKRVDAQCNEVTTHMSGEERELDKLNKFTDGKLRVKCQRNRDAVPED